MQDTESERFTALLAKDEKIRANRIPGVRVVLIILSAKGMVFDIESLRQKILLAYSGAAVFFRSTSGDAIGPHSPAHVDLLIDFTGRSDRQGLFYAKKLRRMARLAVGRNAGFFRKRIYDRMFDESVKAANMSGDMPDDILDRERYVQKEVLALAGVPFVQSGDVPHDKGKSIALELAPLSRL